MKMRTLIILDIVFAAITAFIFAIYKGYSLAIFTAIFLGLLFGSITYVLYGPKPGYEHIRKIQLKAIEQFKERLAREGVIDETEDIARAKSIPLVKENDIHHLLLHIKDFAEIVSTAGRTYAIHRETLNNLLDKLPIKDEYISQLTEAERRILEILQVAGIICHRNGEWRKL